MENEMSDIVTELRERSLRAEQEGEPLALLDEAADEIARLRLTDAEREAIERAMNTVKMFHGYDRKITKSLRGLLQRNGAVDGRETVQ
jgi:hypothetical protein